MNLIQTIILGIVEGISEFLPISSTGHLIITAKLLGLDNEDKFLKLFEVVIQFGAILSIIVIYWKRFLQTMDFYIKLLIAFIPAAIFGLIFNKKIDEYLGYPLLVGITLLLGGIVLIFIDKIFKKTEEQPDNTITNKKALTIGLFQVISMIPGVSRSAATIVGGLTQKLDRRTAAEFSFFLAVPTMFAASCYKLFKSLGDLFILTPEQSKYSSMKLLKSIRHLQVNTSNINTLLVGSAVSFIVAVIAVRFMIYMVTKFGFKAFGWYRVIAGSAVIIAILMGVRFKMGG